MQHQCARTCGKCVNKKDENESEEIDEEWEEDVRNKGKLFDIKKSAQSPKTFDCVIIKLGAYFQPEPSWRTASI